MAALSEEIQTFIVQAHACFRKPSIIRKDVKAEFNLDLKREQILFYHPEKGGTGKRLAQKWKVLFEETRKAYVDGKVLSGIAHQSYRIDLYQRGADYYEETGNYVLASELAEKAAKEMGGSYTNRRELTGNGGGPIETTQLTLEQWTEQANKSLAQAAETMAAFSGGNE